MCDRSPISFRVEFASPRTRYLRMQMQDVLIDVHYRRSVATGNYETFGRRAALCSLISVTLEAELLLLGPSEYFFERSVLIEGLMRVERPLFYF